MHILRWVEQELMTLNRGREESAQIFKALFNCEVNELMEREPGEAVELEAPGQGRKPSARSRLRRAATTERLGRRAGMGELASGRGGRGRGWDGPRGQQPRRSPGSSSPGAPEPQSERTSDLGQCRSSAGQKPVPERCCGSVGNKARHPVPGRVRK